MWATRWLMREDQWDEIISVICDHDPVRKKDVYEKCTRTDVAIAYLSLKAREMGAGYKMKPTK